jgi:hypothetical protein
VIARWFQIEGGSFLCHSKQFCHFCMLAKFISIFCMKLAFTQNAIIPNIAGCIKLGVCIRYNQDLFESVCENEKKRDIKMILRRRE